MTNIKNMNNKKGFTLVEMLVVIAIIAILSSIFLVGLGGFRKQAYDTRRISDVQKIQTFLELYYNQNRFYPDNLATLSNLGTLPKDPIGGADYFYSLCFGNQVYVVGATLDQTSSVLKDVGEIDAEADLGTGANCATALRCDDTAGNYYCVSSK